MIRSEDDILLLSSGPKCKKNFLRKAYRRIYKEVFLLSLEGPWKKRILQEEGITRQCTCPSKHYEFGDFLLKINAKLGGINSVYQALEESKYIPMVQQKATLNLVLDVSLGSFRHYDMSSIAAVLTGHQETAEFALSIAPN